MLLQHLNPEKYAGLTGLRQIGALRFAAELKERGIPHWLRYVLIPGHTDDEDGIQRLIKFCQDQQPALQVRLVACMQLLCLLTGETYTAVQHILPNTYAS